MMPATKYCYAKQGRKASPALFLEYICCLMMVEVTSRGKEMFGRMYLGSTNWYSRTTDAIVESVLKNFPIKLTGCVIMQWKLGTMSNCQSCSLFTCFNARNITSAGLIKSSCCCYMYSNKLWLQLC